MILHSIKNGKQLLEELVYILSVFPDTKNPSNAISGKLLGKKFFPVDGTTLLSCAVILKITVLLLIVSHHGPPVTQHCPMRRTVIAR